MDLEVAMSVDASLPGKNVIASDAVVFGVGLSEGNRIVS